MMKRILILLSFVLIIGFVLGYLYIYQDHRDIQKEEAAYVITASDIAKEFSGNVEKASEKYLNKTLEVQGKITEIEDKAVTLSATVYATFEASFQSSKYTLKQDIKIKGRCIGYDELLEVVRLDQVSIVH